MLPIERDYLILKSQADDIEDLLGRLLFQLLGVAKKNALRMDVYEAKGSMKRDEALAVARETVSIEKAMATAILAVKKAIEEKDVDLSEVVNTLKVVVSSVDNTGKTVSDKLETLIKASPDVREGLLAVRSAIEAGHIPPEAFESIVAGQKRGFESLGKLVVALTEEIKKERTGLVEVTKPVEVAEPKWWKPFTFSWEPLEKLLEKISKRTFKVEQAGAFEVTVKGLPKEISKALAEELTRVMPRMMPHAGYNNPFKFTADGKLEVSGGASGGGDASEATLQAILAALDTVETKLQAIADNTDLLEGYTDGLEGLLTQIRDYVDTLEANTDGLETLTTAVRDYLDTVETKLQSLIDKMENTAILKKTIALTGSGNVHTPGSGKKIRIFNLKFSLSADMTDVAFKFGSGSAFEKYLAPKTGGLYGSNTHPDYNEGAVDEILKCDITGTGTVQINLEYVEV